MNDELLSSLTPIGAFLAELDLSDRSAAERRLNSTLGTEQMREFTALALSAHAAGTLTPRSGGAGVHFGRLSKPSPATHEHSVDAVDITGEGAPHGHPEGEVSWCIPLEGAPVFEGARSGWVVLPPGSDHTPRVRAGRMLIIYFLPNGSIRWSS